MSKFNTRAKKVCCLLSKSTHRRHFQTIAPFTLHVGPVYRSVLPVVLKADQHSHDEKCVNWNEAVIRELLTIRAEAEIVRQFSEMVRAALYTPHEMSRVFTGSLRVVCERMHRFRKITDSVNEPKSDHPGTNHGTHFPCIFRNGYVKEA